MNRIILLALSFCLLGFSGKAFSGESVDSADETVELDSVALYLAAIDSVNNSFDYQTGTVTIGDGLATINVPEGYKFLDAKQAEYVFTELWGNPPSETLGMLLKADKGPLDDDTYFVGISFDEEGYVEDEDAQDMDFEELLETMQSDMEEVNEARKAQGYDAVELVGWAAEPFYDAKAKKLHWAKELRFEGNDVNTLNYNIRILGRKGYLELNAISDVKILPQVQNDVDKVLASVNFNEGHRYSDFNPSIDKVAAYGIGGLIAGKVLAKAGFLSVLAKFGKFIFIGIAGLFALVRKKIFGGE
ncbi:hypothetical protein FUAX_23170 [Fulvitalea axinellae]|uniref:DUF2167 domain-containing protein n=1 Tax=Fulvitalea axinellae TaxID=1182444 RepID=A0AAU9DBX0_9BACT|nr:hypothetical protein FUAX_23170 [Fulvitalea axinellae]